MSGQQRKQSECHRRAPSPLGPKPSSRKAITRGVLEQQPEKKAGKSLGGAPWNREAARPRSQEPTHLPEQQCRLPGKAWYEG